LAEKSAKLTTNRTRRSRVVTEFDDVSTTNERVTIPLSYGALSGTESRRC
jgi:hypothetical protein